MCTNQKKKHHRYKIRHPTKTAQIIGQCFVLIQNIVYKLKFYVKKEQYTRYDKNDKKNIGYYGKTQKGKGCRQHHIYPAQNQCFF